VFRFVVELAHTVRDAAPGDEAGLVALGLATGLFSPAEADELLRDTLRAHHAAVAAGGPPPLSHARVVDGPAAGPAGPAGWAFLQGDAGTGAWELMWIGTARAAEGTGVGRALLRDAEALAARGGAARLVISTSATPATARARAFYERNGYATVSLDKDYYGAGDDRVLYARELGGGGAAGGAAAAPGGGAA